LPAIGEVRLGEATTPLVDKVIASIKGKVSPRRPRAAEALIRVKGEGLLRRSTKSRAGERRLPLPACGRELRRRFMTGARLDQPLFPDVLCGFRDPANVRRELREARGTEALAWITSHTFGKTAATILDEAPCRPAWLRISWVTVGRR
jgi:integrase